MWGILLWVARRRIFWPIIREYPTSSLQFQRIFMRQISFTTAGLQLLRQSTGMLTCKPILIDKTIMNRCRDCLIFFNIWEHVPAKACWSGMQFAYVRANRFITSKCFLCARERNFIPYFPRKLGNPFTFCYLRQVILYSQKVDTFLHSSHPISVSSAFCTLMCGSVRVYTSVFRWYLFGYLCSCLLCWFPFSTLHNWFLVVWLVDSLNDLLLKWWVYCLIDPFVRQTFL
jgi:hypothetical protein